MSEMVYGFAVVDKQGINVKTISPTRRAAIVNWLTVTQRALINNTTSDEAIEFHFRKHSDYAHVAKVEIKEMK